MLGLFQHFVIRCSVIRRSVIWHSVIRCWVFRHSVIRCSVIRRLVFRRSVGEPLLLRQKINADSWTPHRFIFLKEIKTCTVHRRKHLRTWSYASRMWKGHPPPLSFLHALWITIAIETGVRGHRTQTKDPSLFPHMRPFTGAGSRERTILRHCYDTLTIKHIYVLIRSKSYLFLVQLFDGLQHFMFGDVSVRVPSIRNG